MLPRNTVQPGAANHPISEVPLFRNTTVALCCRDAVPTESIHSALTIDSAFECEGNGCVVVLVCFNFCSQRASSRVVLRRMLFEAPRTSSTVDCPPASEYSNSSNTSATVPTLVSFTRFIAKQEETAVSTTHDCVAGTLEPRFALDRVGFGSLWPRG